MFLGSVLCLGASAQSTAAQSVLPPPSPAQPDGHIYGTVTDSAGNVVTGAHVSLNNDDSKHPSTLITDNAGFFDFTGLAAGKYQVAVTSQGFAPWRGPEIVLAPGEFRQIPRIELQVAAANTTVRVTVPQYQLAEEQVHLEEKQRVLGVIPNFYVSYVWNAAPLSSRQKFRLALRTSVDPINILGSGVIAGIEQWQNDFSGYGQGSAGYAKRFGASYADGFIGTMIGGAILPSLLHQDPRYFYKGTGSVRSRTLYAISTVVICKGDNGRWEPNYSNVLGNLASGGISNLYYPASNRGVQLTVDNWLIGTASGAIGALFQEFVVKKLSRGVPKGAAGQP